jgi:trans-L-3-hydroxyproline dehydratase
MRWERTITVIGCHVGGEDNHVIVGGVLPPPGATMFERKRYLETHDDELRRWLLLEPRGKPTLCVNLVTPPTRPDCDVGLIIMESTDYPPMSGSNAICTVTVLLETGILPMREPATTLTLDTPAGPVSVEARCRGGKVERVQFTNVPSFVTHLGVKLDVAGVGAVAADVAYGGAFFAIVDAPSLGFAVEPGEARDLVLLGNRITAAAARQLDVRHPENADICGVTFTEFVLPFAGPGTASRNAVVVAPGRIDRSPCGTGTSARLAVLHARGAARRGAGLRPRVHHRLAVRGGHCVRDDGRRAARHRPDDRRPGLDHRRVPARLRPVRPVPRGLHAARPVAGLIDVGSRTATLEARYDIPVPVRPWMKWSRTRL